MRRIGHQHLLLAVLMLVKDVGENMHVGEKVCWRKSMSNRGFAFTNVRKNFRQHTSPTFI